MNFHDLKAITKEDLFALLVVSAPQVPEATIQYHQAVDHNRNRFNEGHKPKLRERDEIIADCRIEFAKTQMLAMEKVEL